MSVNEMLRAKAPYIFVVSTFFIMFQLSILLNSFPALYRMYTVLPSRIETNGAFWPSLWFSSELIGEIGLIIRFVGACLFVAFAWILLNKKEFSFSILRKAVLLEGTHYLFYTPFIIYLFARPASTLRAQTVYYETAISYTIQTVLVFSTVILLYTTMRRHSTEKHKWFKWGAIAVTSFIFSLWTKHFLFNLYALPIDFTSPVLVLGLLNSTLPMLIAALMLLFAFLPIIREKAKNFNSRTVGIAFILTGVYFIIYILVALVNPGYMAFLPLTELWGIAFAVLGVGFLFKRESCATA